MSPCKKETCRGVPPHADPLVIGARFEDPGDKIGVKSEDHKEMTNDVREKTRPSAFSPPSPPSLATALGVSIGASIKKGRAPFSFVPHVDIYVRMCQK